MVNDIETPHEKFYETLFKKQLLRSETEVDHF